MAGPSIMARLGLDAGDFKKGVADAKRTMSEFAGSIASVVGVAIGASAIKDAIDYAKEIDTLGRKFNMTAESVQRWQKASALVGRTADEVSDSWENLIEAMTKAAAGDREMIGAFNDLGVSMEKVKAGNLEGVLQDMASGSMEAGTAFKLVGENAVKLLPALRQLNSDGVKTADVMGQDVVNGLVQMQRELDKIHNTALRGIGELTVGIAHLWEDSIIKMIGKWTDFQLALKQGKGPLEGIMSIIRGDGVGTKAANQELEETRAKRGQAPDSGRMNVDPDAEWKTGGRGSGGGSGNDEGKRFAEAQNSLAAMNQKAALAGMTPKQRQQAEYDAARKRVKDLADRLKTGGFDGDPAGRAEAQAELGKATLDANGLREKMRDDFIQEGLNGPDAARNAARAERRSRQLGEKFDRMQKLKDRGGKSQVDFDREQRLRGGGDVSVDDTTQGAEKAPEAVFGDQALEQLKTALRELNFVTPPAKK